MNFISTGYKSIPVVADSEVARWAQGCSRGRKLPLDAVEVAGYPHTLFVAHAAVLPESTASDVRAICLPGLSATHPVLRTDWTSTPWPTCSSALSRALCAATASNHSQD